MADELGGAGAAAGGWRVFMAMAWHRAGGNDGLVHDGNFTFTPADAAAAEALQEKRERSSSLGGYAVSGSGQEVLRSSLREERRETEVEKSKVTGRKSEERLERREYESKVKSRRSKV
jgi:hypothetical protein